MLNLIHLFFVNFRIPRAMTCWFHIISCRRVLWSPPFSWTWSQVFKLPRNPEKDLVMREMEESKKSPTGPTERTPKKTWGSSSSIATYWTGSVGIRSHSNFWWKESFQDIPIQSVFTKAPEGTCSFSFSFDLCCVCFCLLFSKFFFVNSGGEHVQL